MPTDSSGWVWWFISVIIVGIAINLFSTFLYPRIEKVGARYSVNRRAKVQAKEREFQRQVQRLVEDPARLSLLKMDLVLLDLRMLVMLVVVVVLFAATQVAPTLMSSRLSQELSSTVSSFVVFMMTFVVLAIINIGSRRRERTRRLVRAAEAKLAAEDKGPAGTPGEESGPAALREKRPAE